jgi:hypothetical protein
MLCAGYDCAATPAEAMAEANAASAASIRPVRAWNLISASS